MKLETVLPYAKIGIAVLAGVVGGSGATMAYKSAPTAPCPLVTPCPKVEVDCKVQKQPPLKVELLCPKK